MTSTQLLVSQKDSRLRWTLIILSILGLVDSIYLAWIKLANATAACAGIGDCEAVNNSPYAEIAGIPIAVLGAGAYVAMIFFLWAEPRGKFWKEYSALIVFGFSLVGVLYSAYLTYVEVAILHAICPYCVISAVLLVAILIISVVRLLREEDIES
ncbi:MAG: vitamin K epoxide reductase family protein [Anaerolineales bacterium]|nr:vitamin K epoxide reductase family protein [Anaerolineales bacterium]